MIKYVFCIICLITFTRHANVFAQSIYPVLIDQVSNGYLFTNPAATSPEKKLALSAFNKSYFGLFENIGVNYASITYQLGKDTIQTSQSTIGATFSNEHDGEFLNRTRAQLLYSHFIKINTQATLGVGLSFGYFNYNIKSSNSNVGTSTWMPDGNIGLWFKMKKLHIGLAVNQFTNAKSSLFVKEYSLTNYQVLNADYEFKIAPQLNLVTGLALFAYKTQWQNKIFATLRYQDQISGGVCYSPQIGTTLLLGLDKLSLFNQKFGLQASYTIAKTDNTMYASSQLELCLQYYITRK
jgi:hypothetical protein